MTARTSHADDRLMLWAPRLVVAVTVAAIVLVGLDADGVLRQVTTALVVLAAPGLAASLAMGSMSIEARVLVSAVGSAALLTVVAMVLALLGLSSPTTGLWVSALVALALILVPLLRRGHDDSAGGDSSAVLDETREASAASGSRPDDDQGERGKDR